MHEREQRPAKVELRANACPHLSSRTYPSSEATSQPHNPVSLAAPSQLIPEVVVAAYSNKMLNIHPGLLPSFGGKGMSGERVHQAVIKSGAR
jgi:formyltetrahydrofolate hydrolase